MAIRYHLRLMAVVVNNIRILLIGCAVFLCGLSYADAVSYTQLDVYKRQIYLFDSPRATPEISFAIRELHADSGVVLTASHNPSHDNCFKAYFNDGAQLVPCLLYTSEGGRRYEISKSDERQMRGVHRARCECGGQGL